MWRRSYVVSAYIAMLLYVTLSCPILSCHVRYFLRVTIIITVHVLAAGCQFYPTVNFTDFFAAQPSIILVVFHISQDFIGQITRMSKFSQ